MIATEKDLVAAMLQRLREPFPPEAVGILAKPTHKNNEKGPCKECGGYHGLPAVHLRFVGHAALTDRLLNIDPYWSWEPMALDQNGLPLFDRICGLWIRLTVCGVTRLGYGDAEMRQGTSAVKEIIGDAIRNAAMRYGCALEFWHKGQLPPPGWFDPSEETPKQMVEQGGFSASDNVEPEREPRLHIVRPFMRVIRSFVPGVHTADACQKYFDQVYDPKEQELFASERAIIQEALGKKINEVEHAWNKKTGWRQ